MSRTIFGTLLGGGAATVYLRPDLVPQFVAERALQSLSNSRNYAATAGNSRELEQLSKLVEQLAKEVQKSKNGQVTIVHSGPDGRGSTYALAGASVAGVLVVYLVVFKKWRLSDFLYVTRRSLKLGLEQVSKGLEDVRGRIDHVKAALQEKINVLMRKQDAMVATQREMQGQLNVMGEDVETIRSQVGQIHGLVLDVSSGLSEVGANQRHANQGIFILCKAVGELMQGSNIPSKRELLEYTQHPIWTADKLQGLEGILCHIDNTEQRRGSNLLLESASSGGGAGVCRALTQGGEPSSMEPLAFGSLGSYGEGIGNGYGHSSNGFGGPSSNGYGGPGSSSSNGFGSSSNGYHGGSSNGRHLPQSHGPVQHSQSFTFGSNGAASGSGVGRVSTPPLGSNGGGILLTNVGARGFAPDPW
ncbi:hypothetical protein N2152v2_005327 [Parachlorella kessleri]